MTLISSADLVVSGGAKLANIILKKQVHVSCMEGVCIFRITTGRVFGLVLIGIHVPLNRKNPNPTMVTSVVKL